jgi:hypothetical protein
MEPIQDDRQGKGATMSWGPYCVKCGHPPGYHGVTFCMVNVGAEKKRPCDCDGYEPVETR